MARVCCFAVAITAGLLSLISLCVAVATDFWFQVKNAADPANNAGAQRFRYPYHVGLWMTCYDEAVPDTVKTENLIRQQCVLDYDFETTKIEDFARTSVVCLVISCAIVSISTFLGIAGCACRRKSPLLLSGILLFLAAITTLIGMCSFIARVLMEQTNSKVPLPSDVTIGFCWSFYVGWGSLAFQLLTGALYVGGVKGCAADATKPGDSFI